jgi:dsDNA-specific endonuclease/ATPase MutS2
VFLKQIIKESKSDDNVHHPKIWWTVENDMLNYLDATKPIEDVHNFYKNFFLNVKKLLELVEKEVDAEIVQLFKSEFVIFFPKNLFWDNDNIKILNLKDQLTKNFIKEMNNFIANLKKKWDNLIKFFKNNKNETPATNKINKVFH